MYFFFAQVGVLENFLPPFKGKIVGQGRDVPKFA
jgi:hypothetical protein